MHMLADAGRTNDNGGWLVRPIVPAVTFLAVILAGCGGPSEPVNGDPEPLVIRGELFYPERIALPPDSLAVIELRAGEAGHGTVAAAQEIELEGRQVPIAFELTIERALLDDGEPHRVRGGVFSRPGPARITEPVTIDIDTDLVELAPLRLHPIEHVPFGTAYRCGEHGIVFGALGDHDWLVVDGRVFALKAVPAASGARYEALDDSATGFWSKGDRAIVDSGGETLPECQAVTGPELPFVARGQEPGWMVRITDEMIDLNADYGATRITFPGPRLQATLGEVAYTASTPEHHLKVVIHQTICADIATGMPHPYRVSYDLNGEGQAGCGGDPKSLLLAEWGVETVADEPPLEDTQITIAFLDDGRVAGLGSCNRYMGGFELTGEGLTFTPMAGTLMACGDEIDRQERRFHEVLGEVYRFSRPEPEQLVLHARTGETITARRAD